MKNDRRKFLQVAGTLTAGAFLFPQLACTDPKPIADPPPMTTPETNDLPSGSLDKFGIQLYTLRDDFPKDPKGVLQQLASFGYQQIEGFEGKQGMFWDMGHLEFKKYLDGLGLNMVSSHCDIKKDFEVKAAQAAEIGMKYLICPYVGPQTSMDAWKTITDSFNECGAICKKNGIRFAYHNHAYSFKPFSGMIPHDFIMENTDPELVDHEMDIYWVVTGGADPIEYLKKYSNRFRLCHVKDRLKDAPAEERGASCDLGTGTIDYPKILKVAKEQGMEYFILEQERYDNSTPIKSAKAGAEYLKKLVFA
ncbi:MAG: sugar phosphate isomerase/epimerase [Saprospiraceae bacterium]|jgi:sugar phosphate isomerase/epimerase